MDNFAGTPGILKATKKAGKKVGKLFNEWITKLFRTANDSKMFYTVIHVIHASRVTRGRGLLNDVVVRA